MKVIIDNREKEEVCAEFSLLADELDERLEFEKQNLLCGDVIIDDCVFERKEAGDFVASLVDRRLFDQVAKMRNNFENVFIIIVGNLWETSSAINPNAIVGAQASLLIRHRVPLMFVLNNHQFVRAVYYLYSKLHDGKVPDYSEKSLSLPYQITHKDRIVMMLSASGIGASRASKIAECFDWKMSKMMSASIDELKEIEGIGPGSAKKLWGLLHS